MLLMPSVGQNWGVLCPVDFRPHFFSCGNANEVSVDRMKLAQVALNGQQAELIWKVLPYSLQCIPTWGMWLARLQIPGMAAAAAEAS